MDQSSKWWEGPDGHLKLERLVRWLMAEQVEPQVILYALAKPWKYTREVLAMEASL